LETTQHPEFKIVLPIQKWVKRSETKNGRTRNWLMLEGYASDTSRDQKGGVFSENAVLGMIECVNQGLKAPVWKDVARANAHATEGYTGPVQGGEDIIGIDIEHSEHWTDQIGYAVEARAEYNLTDEQKKAGMKAPVMVVKCAINTDMSHGRDLEVALEDGKQLGMSVFGGVVDGWTEVSRSGERTDRFEKVALSRIAITQKPANKNMWLTEVKRSMEGIQMEERVEQEATEEVTEVAEPVVEEATEATTANEGNEEAVEPTVEASEEEGEAVEVVETPEVEAEATAEVENVEATADTDATEPVAKPTLEGYLKGLTGEPVTIEADPNILASILPDGGASLEGAETPAVTEVAADSAAVEAAETVDAPAPVSDATSDVVEVITETPAFVARSVYESEMQVYRSELAQIKELLSPLRDLVEETVAYKGEVSRTQGEVSELRSMLSGLVSEIKDMRTRSTGRRGFTVARSMGGPLSDTEEQAVLGHEFKPGSPERLAMIERIKRELGPAAAINYMMGNLQQQESSVVGGTPNPTLQEIEQKIAQAEAKEQESAPAAE
jgi:hypothetical protein